MIDYKPILVIYLKGNFVKEEWAEVVYQLEKTKERTGFEIFCFQNCDENKAEIISADKASIVEDIQKYIDLNLKEG